MKIQCPICRSMNIRHNRYPEATNSDLEEELCYSCSCEDCNSDFFVYYLNPIIELQSDGREDA